MPMIASLIEKDFNDLWFSNPSIRNENNVYEDAILKKNISPFKVEIALFIKEASKIDMKYKDEIELLKTISNKNISGFITTNYDCFLESITAEYQTFVGQEELIFSPIQEIGEIYKIHGSIEKPETIIINNDDYKNFDEKKAYLAAKLMTIFIEYPIIFIGYSITDTNIQTILKSIVTCLPADKIKELQDRLVFIEYKENKSKAEISSHTISLANKQITMTKIILNDFKQLFIAMQHKTASIPVKTLRFVKNSLYNFIITNEPNSTIRVGNIQDPSVKGTELAVYIGTYAEFGRTGLIGVTSNEWYRNIIMDDIDKCTVDDLLEHTYPRISKQSHKLPLHKYLSKATKSFPEYQNEAEKINFDSFICKSIRQQRNKYKDETVTSIINNNSIPDYQKLNMLAYLSEKTIGNAIDTLYSYIKNLFEADNEILENKKTHINLPTYLRRMIRVYDYIKYKKRET